MNLGIHRESLWGLHPFMAILVLSSLTDANALFATTTHPSMPFVTSPAEACSFLLLAETELAADRLHRYVAAAAGVILLVTAYGFLIRDARQRRRVEEKLRDSSEHLGRIVNAVVDGIVVLQGDGIIDSVNPAAERLFGYGREELTGQRIDLLLPEAGSITSDMAGSDAGDPAAGREVIGRHLSGTCIRVQLSVITAPSKGRPVHTILLRDMTERKRTEEALETRADQQGVVARLGQQALAGVVLSSLMDEAVTCVARTLGMDSVCVLELGADDRMLLLRAGVGIDTTTGQEAVELEPDSELAYAIRSQEPVVVPDYASEVRFKRNQAFTEQKIVSSVSVVIHGRARTFGLLSASAKHLHGLTPDEVFFLQAVANILSVAIERDRAEEEIRQLNEDLERRVIERTAQVRAVNAELEAFSYSVSHDLRAPLRAMDGFSRALLDDYGPVLDETAMDYLNRVCAASQRMASLIDDLLNLSRVTRSEIRQEVVDLTAMVSSVFEELRTREPERAVEIVIAQGIVVRADDRLLRVAMENLLQNAWKFTGKIEHARIEFGVSTDELGDQVFFVRDNGAGFDPAYSDKLFRPFQRLHSNNEFKGTGIGLATVQRIIRRHGGRIWAESQPGEGAVFRFTLHTADGTL